MANSLLSVISFDEQEDGVVGTVELVAERIELVAERIAGEIFSDATNRAADATVRDVAISAAGDGAVTAAAATGDGAERATFLQILTNAEKFLPLCLLTKTECNLLTTLLVTGGKPFLVFSLEAQSTVFRIDSGFVWNL